MKLRDKFQDINQMGDGRVLQLLTSLFGGPGGSQSITGVFGDTLTAKRKPLFSSNFSYPANTKGVTQNVVNGGTVDYNLNLLRVRSNTTVGGGATVRTKRQLRYTAGRDAEAMATAVFKGQSAGDSYQRIGIFDNEDGFFIGFNGDIFGVTRRKDTGSGIENEFIPQSEFNGDKLDGTGDSRVVIDFTKMNVYRINYGYLGTAEIKYQVQGTVNGITQFITFHTIDRRNEVDNTHIRVPYLPLCIECDNGTTTNDVQVETASIYAGIFDGAKEDRAARLFSANLVSSVIAGTDVSIGIFHNKDVFRSLENHIEASLLYFTAGVQSQSNKTITINIYRLPDQNKVSGAWSDIDSLNSTFEVSSDEPITLTNKELLISFALSPSDSIQVNLKDLFVNALPNDYIGITATSTGASEVRVTFRWEELF